MPESAFADAHFFDVYLKGEGTFPKTPELSDWRSHGGPMIVLGNRCWSWRTSSTEMNGWSAYAGVKQGSYFAAKPIAKTGDWQTIEIALTNLKPLDDKSAAPGSWQFATELGLVAQVRGKRQAQTLAGGEWPAPRQLRNLRWSAVSIRSSSSSRERKSARRNIAEPSRQKMDKSVEQEKRDATKAP